MTDSRLTAELLAHFSAYLQLDRGLGARTIEAYASDLRGLLETPGFALASATRGSLEKHLARLLDHGLTHRSIARKLSAYRLFFAFAVAEKHIATDPTENLIAGAPVRRLPETLSAEQVESLLEAPVTARNTTDALMLRLLYASGLRVSELVGLRPDQLDLQAGIVRVQGKGEKARIVPLDAETVTLLEAYLRDLRPVLALKNARPRGGTPQEVFLSRQGRGFTRQGFWKVIKKYSRAAGLPSSVSPHVLRHAFATHLLERGMSLRSLQLLLGHSDISTTEIYSHVSASHLAETLVKHHPRRKTKSS